MIGAAKCLMSSTLLSTVAALDVSKLFATSLYTGTGAAQTITNGIDLAGKGGLIWGKTRSSAGSNTLFDTARGVSNRLYSDQTSAEATFAGSGVTAFNSTGFSLGGNVAGENLSGSTEVSWSFAQDPRFFKIVTYTGNGTTQVIPHGLDPSVSVGMVIIKQRDGARSWYTWHRGLTAGRYLLLESTAAQTNTFASQFYGNNTATVDPTSSGVTVGSNLGVNGSGNTYIMYVFAHDTASDGVVQCGSANAGSSVTLGWRPQFLLIKDVVATYSWWMVDAARGFSSGNDPGLSPNQTSAEQSFNYADPLTTGFSLGVGGAPSGDNMIYLAIRAPGG